MNMNSKVPNPRDTQFRDPDPDPGRDSRKSQAEKVQEAGVHVRGIHALGRSAQTLRIVLSTLVDLSSFGVVFSGVYRAQITFHPSYAPSLGTLILSLALSFLLLFLELRFFRTTLGGLIWGLRLKSTSAAPLSLRIEHLKIGHLKIEQWKGSSLTERASSIFFTVLVALLGSLSGYELLSNNPLVSSNDPLQLDAFQPEPDSTTISTHAAWALTPFFYTIGAWPTNFEGNPIWYSLPYEKGPPRQFVGHIVARWQAPAIELILEGPFTPWSHTHAPEARLALKECLSSGSLRHFYSCFKARELALSRILNEMTAAGGTKWNVNWFEVKTNEALAQNSPQGIAVELLDEPHGKAQQTFVLINPSGALQSFTLKYPLNEVGARARRLFEQAIRSQKISDDLSTGRAWVDHLLEQTHFTETKSVPPTVEKLAEVQKLLLAKISVDPKSFDAYFHLGGTASLLAQEAIREKNLDWNAVAKPLIKSSLRYAQDISPDDPRTAQLQTLWLGLKDN